MQVQIGDVLLPTREEGRIQDIKYGLENATTVDTVYITLPSILNPTREMLRRVLVRLSDIFRANGFTVAVFYPTLEFEADKVGSGVSFYIHLSQEQARLSLTLPLQITPEELQGKTREQWLALGLQYLRDALAAEFRVEAEVIMWHRLSRVSTITRPDILARRAAVVAAREGSMQTKRVRAIEAAEGRAASESVRLGLETFVNYWGQETMRALGRPTIPEGERGKGALSVVKALQNES